MVPLPAEPYGRQPVLLSERHRIGERLQTGRGLATMMLRLEAMTMTGTKSLYASYPGSLGRGARGRVSVHALPATAASAVVPIIVVVPAVTTAIPIIVAVPLVDVEYASVVHDIAVDHRQD